MAPRSIFFFKKYVHTFVGLHSFSKNKLLAATSGEHSIGSTFSVIYLLLHSGFRAVREFQLSQLMILLFQKTVNQADIGSEGEFETQGKKIKCKVTGSTSDVQMAATSGWANASAKIVGNQLVESITHNESNTTLTTYWDKA